MRVRPVDPDRSRIMLVGTPKYCHPELPDVPVVANNVADLAAVFTDPGLGGFDTVHCVAVPAGAGVARVDELLHEAVEQAEDLLLFYYSGHGLLGSRRRELYLSLADTNPDRLASTALRFEAVREACLDSRAKNRVVILDSCFSGRAIGETLSDGGEAVLSRLEVEGTYTLTSAPANRTAIILPGETHTAFTERLLSLLRDGIPEAGEMLSLGDIYPHLRSRLQAAALPIPQQCSTATAHMLGLVRNRPPAPAGGQPESLPGVSQVAPETHQGRVMLGARAETLLDRAERATAHIADLRSQETVLNEIAKAVALSNPDRAEHIADTIPDTRSQETVLNEIAKAVALSNPDRVEHIAARITDTGTRARALSEIGKTVASNDPHRASRLFDEAEQLVATEIDTYWTRIGTRWTEFDQYGNEIDEGGKEVTLFHIAMAVAPSDPDRAEHIADKITDESTKLTVLARILAAVAPSDPDRAERVAATITDTGKKAWALTRITHAVAPNHPDRAKCIAGRVERVTESIPDSLGRVIILPFIVRELAPSNPDHAERIAATITDTGLKEWALSDIAQAVALSDPDRAEHIATTKITDTIIKAQTMAQIARVWLGTASPGAL